MALRKFVRSILAASVLIDSYFVFILSNSVLAVRWSIGWTLCSLNSDSSACKLVIKHVLFGFLKAEAVLGVNKPEIWAFGVVGKICGPPVAADITEIDSLWI